MNHKWAIDGQLPRHHYRVLRGSAGVEGSGQEKPGKKRTRAKK